MTNDKYTIGPARPTPPTICIKANDGRALLTIKPDGTVTGEIEDASEAARLFVESLRGYFPQPTQSDEWEVLAVGYQALSGKAYHMSDCATCCAPAEKPSPCDCDAPTQSDALRIACEASVAFEKIFGFPPEEEPQAAAVFIGQYMRTAAHDFDVAMRERGE